MGEQGAGWYPDPAGGPRRQYWDGQQWGPYEPEPAPAPAQSTGRQTALTLVGVVVAAIILTVVIVGVVGAIKKNDRPAASSAPGTSTPSGYPSIAAPPSSSQGPSYVPVPTDFAIDVIVTEQKCFGSAGCNYEFTIDPTYLRWGAPTNDSDSFTVIYEILGGEDPLTGNFTMSGGQIRYDKTGRLQGSQGAVFTARVTQVVRQ